MLVLAAVSGIQFHKLRRAAAARFAVVHASSWDAVLAAIRSRPVELAVVDPLLTGTASDREIERLRVLFPSLPLILYTSLTPQTAAVLLALGQRGIRHVVFCRYDDHPVHLRHVLAQEEVRSTSQQLLDQFAWALSPLPSELRWVLEEVLRSPAEVQTVQQVAARARVDRRTFERWFMRVGLPSPRHFLAAARVLYAHRLLQDPGSSSARSSGKGIGCSAPAAPKRPTSCSPRVRRTRCCSTSGCLPCRDSRCFSPSSTAGLRWRDGSPS